MRASARLQGRHRAEAPGERARFHTPGHPRDRRLFSLRPGEPRAGARQSLGAAGRQPRAPTCPRKPLQLRVPPGGWYPEGEKPRPLPSPT